MAIVIRRQRLDPDLDLAIDVGLLDSSAARHKIAVRQQKTRSPSRHKESSHDKRGLMQSVEDPTKQGRLPAVIFMTHATSIQPHDIHYRREAVIRELVETEEEFGRDLQLVVERYVKPLDSSTVPRTVRDNKELIFGNLKQIADFHNTVLIEGVKYYANEPRMLGKTFLRLERDFDKHVSYCRDEPMAQDFLLENNVARDFFEIEIIKRIYLAESVVDSQVLLMAVMENSLQNLIRLLSPDLIPIFAETHFDTGFKYDYSIVFNKVKSRSAHMKSHRPPDAEAKKPKLDPHKLEIAEQTVGRAMGVSSSSIRHTHT